MFQIGWAQTDLTLDGTIEIVGQFHTRLSEGVRDPLTATALALDGGNGPDSQLVLVSCDCGAIPDALLRALREKVADRVDLPVAHIILNATHTHAGPELRPPDLQHLHSISARGNGIDLPARPVTEVVAEWIAKLANLVAAAWAARAPGSVAYGLGQAVLGRNRRSCYRDGSSRMYGKTDQDDFSHIEGFEDHDLGLIATYDGADNLTGLVVNTACPSQVTEQIYEQSADFWHEARVALRGDLGEHLYLLPQCSAAGDLSPHIQYHKPAEARMRRLAALDERQEIADRILHAITRALPIIARDKVTQPVLAHRSATLHLPMRPLSQADADAAAATIADIEPQMAAALAAIEADPACRETPRWYVPYTQHFRRISWNMGVIQRFERQATENTRPAELHVIRIGDLALATNPFELYLDYGIQIKARSAAVQTMLVQLAGPGTYLPSERAVAGGSYGAVPASTPVGPEGGHELVAWTLQTIDDLFT